MILHSTNKFIAASFLAAFLLAATPCAAAPNQEWIESWLTRQVLVRELVAPLTHVITSKKKTAVFVKGKAGKAAKARVRLALIGAPEELLKSLPVSIHATNQKFIADLVTKGDVNKILDLGFRDQVQRRRIAGLISGSTRPKCKISNNEVKQYLSHQARVIMANQQAYAPELTKFIENWSEVKVQCLIIHLAKDFTLDPNGDYLALTMTLHQLGRLNTDFTKAVLATRYFIAKNYAESLRHLYELQLNHDRFRILYDLVQRQYSQVQRGKGDVSIKSL